MWGIISVNLPTNIHDELDRTGGRLDLKTGDSRHMLLCGLIQYDNLLNPMLICELVSYDPEISDSWEMRSMSVDPIRLRNFKNKIQQKMNAHKIID